MKSKHCLIVDDSKSARFTLKKLIEKLGHEADCVNSGDEALKYLGVMVPDVILMDHLMPGKDGFETSRDIKNNEKFSAVPIIMCTSKEGEEFVLEAESIGISGVLPKPASINQIQTIFNKIDEAKEKEKETEKEQKPVKAKRPKKNPTVNLGDSGNQPKQTAGQQLSGQPNVENMVIRVATGIARQIARDVVEERWSELRPILYEDAVQLSQRLVNESIEDLKKSVIKQTSEENESLIQKMVKPLVREHAEQLVNRRIADLDTKIYKELKSFKIDVQQAFPDPDSLHEALVEDAKNAAEFTATHKALEIAKRVSSESTDKKVSSLMANTYLPQIEDHIHEILSTKNRKFLQLQILATTAVIVSLFSVMLTLLV